MTDQAFIEQLHELHHKIDFVKEQSYKEAVSCVDVSDVLERLKIKVLFKYGFYILYFILSSLLRFCWKNKVH